MSMNMERATFRNHGSRSDVLLLPSSMATLTSVLFCFQMKVS